MGDAVKLEEWQKHVTDPRKEGSSLCGAVLWRHDLPFNDAAHWLASHQFGSRIQGCHACVRVILEAAQEQLGEAVES